MGMVGPRLPRELRRSVGTQVRYSYWRGTTRPREAFHSGRVFALRAPLSSSLARLVRVFLALVAMILSHLPVRRFVELTPHVLEGEESYSRGLGVGTDAPVPTDPTFQFVEVIAVGGVVIPVSFPTLVLFLIPTGHPQLLARRH